MISPGTTPWRDDARDDTNPPPLAIGDEARDDTGRLPLPSRRCPVCSRPFRPVGRQVYHQPACKQRAFRQRQRAALAPPPRARDSGFDRVAHTLYACPQCEEEYLGERRCPDCNLMCRNVGLAVRCSSCDDVLRLDDLLAELGLRLAAPISRSRGRSAAGAPPLE